MFREALSADELRNIEEGTHLVVYLTDDCYWEMGEGIVTNVDSGRYDATIISLNGLRGHPCKLWIPGDARKTWTFDGAGTAANGLPVKRVEER